MLGRRSDIPRLQSDFYRDQFRKILRWLMMSVLIMFVLLATVIYLILFKPATTYYANTSSGKILDMPKAVTG